MRLALGTSVCCLFLLGCCTDPPKASFIREKDPTATRAELLKLIPVGTPLNKAEAILVKNGFRRVTDPSTWPKPERGTAPIPSGKFIEDPRCVTYGIDVPIDSYVIRTWFVELYHKADAVEDIKVTAGGLTGP
jgi:hypothetical protein